jgi:hypothetical protein
MTKLNLNLEKVSEFENLPDDEYFVEISDATVESGKKAPYVQLWFDVITAKNSGETYKNRSIMCNLSTSPNAASFFRAFLKAIGYNEKDLLSKNFEIDTESFKGKKLRIDYAFNDATGYSAVTAYKKIVSEQTKLS